MSFGDVGRRSRTQSSEQEQPAKQQPQPSSDAQKEELEQVNCHVIDDHNILLPFLERPSEVNSLLFETPAMSNLATRLRSWINLRKAVGQDTLHILVKVDRDELGDHEWLLALRTRLIKDAPELWAQLIMALGGEHIPLHAEAGEPRRFDSWSQRVKEHAASLTTGPSSNPDEAIDDAVSELSSVAPIPGETRRSKSRGHSRPSSIIEHSPRDSAIDVEGLHFLPRSYSKSVSQVQQPSFGDEEDEEAAAVAQSQAPSTNLPTDSARPPTARQPSTDSASLATPMPGFATPTGKVIMKTPVARPQPQSSLHATSSGGGVGDYFNARPGARDRSADHTQPATSRQGVSTRKMSVSLSSPHLDEAGSESPGSASGGRFAGLRIRSRSEATDDSAASAASSPRSRRSSRIGSTDAPLSFKTHHRLSDLISDPARPQPGAQLAPPRRIARHRHQPSISMGVTKEKEQLFKARSSHQPPNPHDVEDRLADLTNLKKHDLSLRETAGQKPHAKNKDALSYSRPLGTPGLDDAELLFPQKSRYSFARSFDGPTLSDPRHHKRPKAFSMTQYSSSREQYRLDIGKEGAITPYEQAAELEAKGAEKPRDLGVLKDGRTRHPSAGTAKSPAAVASFRAAVGLSPAMPARSSASSSSSNSPDDSKTPSRSVSPLLGATSTGSGSSPSPSKSGTTTPMPIKVPSAYGDASPRGGSSSSSPASRPSSFTPLRREVPPAIVEPATASGSKTPGAVWGGVHHASPPGVTGPARSNFGASGTGFALGGGFMTKATLQTSQGSNTPPQKSSPHRTAPPLPSVAAPKIHRRPGGFSSFSQELEAIKRARTRATSDAAFSSGSQAVASSEGTPPSDFDILSPDSPARAGGGLSADPNNSNSSGIGHLSLGSLGRVGETEDEEAAEEQHAGPGATSALRGDVPEGELGIDFGDDQEENNDGKFLLSPSSSASGKLPPGAYPPPSPTTSSKPGTNARGLRPTDHIIIPVPPGGPQSRPQALQALLRSDDLQPLITDVVIPAIGAPAWSRAFHLLADVERSESPDRELLERLARRCFGLVDLDAEHPAARAKAEEVVCEDLEAYERRFRAFERFIDEGLGVPQTSVAEAKRRCAPGQLLSLSG